MIDIFQVTNKKEEAINMHSQPCDRSAVRYSWKTSSLSLQTRPDYQAEAVSVDTSKYFQFVL